MSVEDTIDILDNNDEVLESYVLVSEMKIFLDIGYESYHPEIKVKIYKSSVMERMPYHFEVSHHAHTPEQAGPYHPSRTSASTESEAISEAISTTTSFLKGAISSGHEPSDGWLVPNGNF